MPKISFAAAGDMLICRLIPTDYPGARAVRDYISKADVSFCNLETVLHRGGRPFRKPI